MYHCHWNHPYHSLKMYVVPHITSKRLVLRMSSCVFFYGISPTKLFQKIHIHIRTALLGALLFDASTHWACSKTFSNKRHDDDQPFFHLATVFARREFGNVYGWNWSGKKFGTSKKKSPSGQENTLNRNWCKLSQLVRGHPDIRDLRSSTRRQARRHNVYIFE